MATVKATIFFEKRFWVGLFERTDKEGYAVARHIFGGEPSDAEVYEFVLHEYLQLKFGDPKEVTIQIQRMNPKRVQREVRKEMEKMKESSQPSTFAQDYMREELEKKKKKEKASQVLKSRRAKMSNSISNNRNEKKSKKGINLQQTYLQNII